MRDLVVFEDIKSKIYTIRGMQVMLDSDLAELYQVETRVLNQAVKRNIKRFPDSFCFQLNEAEFNDLKSHFVISKANWGGVRKLPFVFTEHGVTMLSTVLRSDAAVQIGISVVNAFVSMRHIINENALTFQRLRDIDLKLLEHDKNFNEIFRRLVERPR